MRDEASDGIASGRVGELAPRFAHCSGRGGRGEGLGPERVLVNEGELIALGRPTDGGHGGSRSGAAQEDELTAVRPADEEGRAELGLEMEVGRNAVEGQAGQGIGGFTQPRELMGRR